jgi:hypothetical protein
MMDSRMMCRYSATLVIEPVPRSQSTGSVRILDEDVLQPKTSRTPRAMGGVETTSGATLALVADKRPRKDHEAAALEARRQWKSRFRARVRTMEKLLANAPDDNVPTPRGDGDD